MFIFFMSMSRTFKILDDLERVNISVILTEAHGQAWSMMSSLDLLDQESFMGADSSSFSYGTLSASTNSAQCLVSQLDCWRGSHSCCTPLGTPLTPLRPTPSRMLWASPKHFCQAKESWLTGCHRCQRLHGGSGRKFFVKASDWCCLAPSQCPLCGMEDEKISSVLLKDK